MPPNDDALREARTDQLQVEVEMTEAWDGRTDEPHRKPFTRVVGRRTLPSRRLRSASTARRCWCIVTCPPMFSLTKWMCTTAIPSDRAGNRQVWARTTSPSARSPASAARRSRPARRRRTRPPAGRPGSPALSAGRRSGSGPGIRGSASISHSIRGPSSGRGRRSGASLAVEGRDRLAEAVEDRQPALHHRQRPRSPRRRSRRRGRRPRVGRAAARRRGSPALRSAPPASRGCRGRSAPAGRRGRRLEAAQIRVDRLLDRGVGDDPAALEQDAALAERLDDREVVGDEDDRPPLAATSLIFASDLRWKAASPTASTSSTSRISGSRWAATAKASRTDMPLE